VGESEGAVLESVGWAPVGGERACLGPDVGDGDLLAFWVGGDAASDLFRLVDLLCGPGSREAVEDLVLRERVFLFDIHVHSGGRRADLWATLSDGVEVSGVYVMSGAFVSPEVLEMVKVAAIGKGR